MTSDDQPQAKNEYWPIIAWLIAGFVLGFAGLGVLLQGGFADGALYGAYTDCVYMPV